MMHSKTTTYIDRLGCDKKVYLTLSRNVSGDDEIHIFNGRNGSCSLAYASALSQIANLALRKGATISEIAAILSGIRCSKESIGVKSCMDALGKDLLDSINLP